MRVTEIKNANDHLDESFSIYSRDQFAEKEIEIDIIMDTNMCVCVCAEIDFPIRHYEIIM